MTIRFAKKNDVAQIVELCKAHAEYERASFDPTHKQERLTHHLFDSDALYCLVVAEGTQILGYATFMRQFSTWNAEYYLYLDCLFLKEETRSKGIGFQLMSNVKDFAISKHCSWIEWQTPDFNTNAIKFYTRLGATSKSKERFSWEVQNANKDLKS